MGGVRLGFPLQLDDAAIKHRYRNLGTVSDVEPAEDQVDMPFHGGLGDAQALRRLVMPSRSVSESEVHGCLSRTWAAGSLPP